MSLSETSSPRFVLPLGSPEGWGGAAPSPIAGLFVGTLRRTGQEPLQQSPSTSSQSGKWDMVQVFPGGACQTSSDACVPGLGLQAHSGGLSPIPLPGTLSEGLHILMGCSHPIIANMQWAQRKRAASSPRHPPPQSHLVTKRSLIPSSGEGDSTVPSHATQDLSPSKSHLEIMNPPGLRSFQAL